MGGLARHHAPAPTSQQRRANSSKQPVALTFAQSKRKHRNTSTAARHRVTVQPMNQFRHASARDVRHRLDPAGTRRRALLAIPALGVLVLVLLWTVIFARLSVEKETTYREAMASAAILSAALEQHT